MVWDSSVLLALMNGEPDAAGCESLLGAVAAGRAELVFPTVVVAEVLWARYPAGVRAAVDRVFALPGVRVIALDVGLARRAADLRAAPPVVKPAGGRKPRTLGVADGIIAVTAAAHADALYTADVHLLRLAGHPLLGGLTITHPPPGAAATANPTRP